jgi:hypothetical protein
MYIPVSESGEPFYWEGFPVRLFKSDGSNWIANFEPGWTELCDVIDLKKTSNILIVAQGKCYLMNTEETKPIRVFGAAYTKVLQLETGQLVFQGQDSLTIVEPNGEHWKTERISFDGLKDVEYIKDIEHTNGLVKGLSFDQTNGADEWVPFSYIIEKKELIGGSYNRFGPWTPVKPWWKFW